MTMERPRTKDPDIRCISPISTKVYHPPHRPDSGRLGTKEYRRPRRGKAAAARGDEAGRVMYKVLPEIISASLFLFASVALSSQRAWLSN